MLSQIYITAMMVTLIVLFIVYLVARWGNFEGKKVFIAIIAGLPLSSMVNIFIKKPVILYILKVSSLENNMDTIPVYILILSLLVVGFSEEAIKMAPALLPPISKMLFRANYYKMAFSWIIGVGFGLGEAYYIAYAISLNPAYSGYPYYYFTGYMNERIIACLIHGILTVLALYGWPSSKKIIATYILASIAHSIIDIPATLYQTGVIDIAMAEISTGVIGFIAIIVFLYILNRAREDEFAHGLYGDIGSIA